jgi:hypothetical protein
MQDFSNIINQSQENPNLTSINVSLEKDPLGYQSLEIVLSNNGKSQRSVKIVIMNSSSSSGNNSSDKSKNPSTPINYNKYSGSSRGS